MECRHIFLLFPLILHSACLLANWVKKRLANRNEIKPQRISVLACRYVASRCVLGLLGKRLERTAILALRHLHYAVICKNIIDFISVVDDYDHQKPTYYCLLPLVMITLNHGNAFMNIALLVNAVMISVKTQWNGEHQPILFCLLLTVEDYLMHSLDLLGKALIGFENLQLNFDCNKCESLVIGCGDMIVPLILLNELNEQIYLVGVYVGCFLQWCMFCENHPQPALPFIVCPILIIWMIKQGPKLMW